MDNDNNEAETISSRIDLAGVNLNHMEPQNYRKLGEALSLLFYTDIEKRYEVLHNLGIDVQTLGQLDLGGAPFDVAITTISFLRDLNKLHLLSNLGASALPAWMSEKPQE